MIKQQRCKLTSDGRAVGAHGDDDGLDVRLELLDSRGDALRFLDGELPHQGSCIFAHVSTCPAEWDRRVRTSDAGPAEIDERWQQADLERGTWNAKLTHSAIKLSRRRRERTEHRVDRLEHGAGREQASSERNVGVQHRAKRLVEQNRRDMWNGEDQGHPNVRARVHAALELARDTQAERHRVGVEALVLGSEGNAFSTLESGRNGVLTLFGDQPP